MRWNWLRRASLRARLLALLWPAMALVVVASLWLTRSDAVDSANAAYDRSLLGAIKALDLNVSTASGGLSVELPYRLFEFFELTATGNVYFRVATGDGLVEIGSPDLPKPPAALKLGQPQFYDALYFGESVRVGAFMRTLEQPLTSSIGSPSSAQLVIQVAESTASREQFTSSFIKRSLVRDTLLLLVMGLAVVIGLTIALRPLNALASQTENRAEDDDRPLDTVEIPREIKPLVEAVNLQMQRSHQLAVHRRRLIDDASHQLRTPLSILRAQLDFALRQPADQQQAALQALSEELNLTIRATNQLLALARQDASQAASEQVDLHKIARDVALEMLPLAKSRGIDLGLDTQSEIQSETLQVTGDAGMLHQALSNLTHNAILHGKDQGLVTIKAFVRANAGEQTCVLQVLDDGPGFDPEVLKQLGQRFAKGKNSRGSGLGLAIARAAVELHGGSLQVDTISLPFQATQSTFNSVSLEWPRT
jgi:two-component system, OmpR family, sensor histidine kinase TctE